MDDKDIEYWLKLDNWYHTEAALILVDIDPRFHTAGTKPSKRILREQFPDALELLAIFERSDLLKRYPEKQNTWRFLAAAYKANRLNNPVLRQHFEAWLVENYLALGARFDDRTGLANYAQKILHKYPALVKQFNGGCGVRKLSYENENLRRALGLLLSAFLQQRQSSLLGTIEKPNVSQIVKALMAHTSAVKIDSEGLGKTSLTEKINAAIKQFHESRIG